MRWRMPEIRKRRKSNPHALPLPPSPKKYGRRFRLPMLFAESVKRLTRRVVRASVDSRPTMTGAPLVVLDACVLAKFSLYDTLRRLAEPLRLFEKNFLGPFRPPPESSVSGEDVLFHRPPSDQVFLNDALAL